MNLTPEEARAVEAARAWNRSGFQSESPLEAAWINAKDDDEETEALYAIGYLAGDRDGYRRGVEAAARSAEAEDADPLTKREWDRSGSAAKARADRIRALLAQDGQRG